MGLENGKHVGCPEIIVEPLPVLGGQRPRISYRAHATRGNQLAFALLESGRPSTSIAPRRIPDVRCSLAGIKSNGMNGSSADDSAALATKIARLVQERGWNMEEFARISGLNRLTVRQILLEGTRRLRNATVGACARALGLTVSELRELPLQTLLSRINATAGAAKDAAVRRLYDEATQPELLAWLERNPERAGRLTAAELDELLSLQGTGGPMTGFGVEHFVELIERKRKLKEQVDAIAGTEYLELLEQMVRLMYEKIQPYRERKP
jgi:transcriptional regulator with XRE-family HTH domain